MNITKIKEIYQATKQKEQARKTDFDRRERAAFENIKAAAEEGQTFCYFYDVSEEMVDYVFELLEVKGFKVSDKIFVEGDVYRITIEGWA